METAIVFRATSDYYFNVANLIINIEKYSPNFCSDYIVFTNNILDKNFKSIFEIVSFYKKNLKIRSYSKEYFKSKTKINIVENSFFKRYPLLIFSIFEIFNLLKEYYDVLILDLDMFLYDSIDDIKKLGPFAMRPARRLNDQLSRSRFEDNFKTPNAGTIYVSRELKKYELYTDLCYNILTEFYDEILDTYEEVTLGILINREKIQCNNLLPYFNKVCTTEKTIYSKLIHVAGCNKHWQDYEILNLFPEIKRSIIKFNNITKNKYKNIDISAVSDEKNIERYFMGHYWNEVYSLCADIIPNCYILNNNNNRFLQLFIHNIPRTIHYELSIKYKAYKSFVIKDFYRISKRNLINTINIQLHFENNNGVSELKTIFKDLFFFNFKNLIIIDKPWQFGYMVESDIKNFIKTLSEFYNKSINIILQNYKK